MNTFWRTVSWRIIPAPADADLSVLPHAVLARMQAGDPAWEALVPEKVVAVIKERKLFGYGRTR